MKVLLLSVWNSRMEVLLLLSTIAISCLVIGPIIFYIDVFGNILTSVNTNLDSIPKSKFAQINMQLLVNRPMFIMIFNRRLLVGGCNYDNRWLRWLLSYIYSWIFGSCYGHDFWPDSHSFTCSYNWWKLHHVLWIQHQEEEAEETEASEVVFTMWIK